MASRYAIGEHPLLGCWCVIDRKTNAVVDLKPNPFFDTKESCQAAWDDQTAAQPGKEPTK